MTGSRKHFEPLNLAIPGVNPFEQTLSGEP